MSDEGYAGYILQSRSLGKSNLHAELIAAEIGRGPDPLLVHLGVDVAAGRDSTVVFEQKADGTIRTPTHKTMQDMLSEVTKRAFLPLPGMSPPQFYEASPLMKVLLQNASKSNPPFAEPVAEFRPPVGTEDSTLHWVEYPLLVSRTMVKTTLAWVNGCWLIHGDESEHSPREMAEAGYRYLGPAEYYGTAEQLRTALEAVWKMAWEMQQSRDEAGSSIAGKDMRIADLEAENARLRAAGHVPPKPSFPVNALRSQHQGIGLKTGRDE